MPPKAIKVKPKIKCIKFGEILIDENKKIMLLCVNCNVDFSNYQEFSYHLKTKCTAVKHIFKSTGKNIKLDCGAGNLLTNVTQANRELLVYDIHSNTNVDSDDCVLNIEQEILNPRWYTDGTQSSPINKKDCTTYNDLIEEVTPFVQFKENVRTPSTPKRLKITQNQKPATNNNNQIKRKSLPEPKVNDIKRISVPQTQKQVIPQKNNVKAPQTTSMPTTNLSLKRKIKENPTNQKIVCKQEIVTPPAIKRQCTQQVINSKLQSTTNIKQNPQEMIINLTTSPNKNNIIAQIQQQPQQRTRQQTFINAQKTIAAPQQLTNTKSNIKLINNNLQQKPTPPKIITHQIMATTNPSINSHAPVLVPISAPAPVPAKDKTTVDILNKLQTLGLKVQRTNPTPTILPNYNEKNDAAMEIIKKLQSKGMEVKRVPKQFVTKETISTMTVPLISTSGTAIQHSTPIVLSAGKPYSQHNIFIQKIT